MAENIVQATASFTTNNMKPDNSEVIPALWGKNVADNTGYLKEQIETEQKVIVSSNAIDLALCDATTGAMLAPLPDDTKIAIPFVKNALHDHISGTVLRTFKTADKDRGCQVQVAILNEDYTAVGTMAAFGTDYQSVGAGPHDYRHSDSFWWSSAALVADTTYFVQFYGTFTLIAGGNGLSAPQDGTITKFGATIYSYE